MGLLSDFRTAFRPTVAAALFAASLLSPSFAHAQNQPQPTQVVTLHELSNLVWANAQNGKDDLVLSLLNALPANADDPNTLALHNAGQALSASLAKREEQRAAKLAEVRAEFTEELAKGNTDTAMSEALRAAVEMYLLVSDKSAVLLDPRVNELITRAGGAARAAEARGDWLTANELFYRLNTLLEERGTYKEDVKRLGSRLSMIRLYAPQRFWDLRNEQRIAQGKDPLPPYNGLGEDYREKLAGIDREMVLRALGQTENAHVDRSRLSLREIMADGLLALKTFATTKDLQSTFPGIADDAARDEFTRFIDSKLADLNKPGAFATRSDLYNLINETLAVNQRTIKAEDNAILHEFGDGSFAALIAHGDDFSAIVWPDEKQRFERMTQGRFRGVGIHIQLDDEKQMIKVVTPLEGTPAHRAGILADDLIKRIDGKDAIGITLNQAVDLITGPEDSPVNLTIEREGNDIDFRLLRKVIPITSVKGWRRLGAREDQWDWYIDRDRRIGYIRLTGFQEDTTTELQRAIAEMKRDGLNALILDLRFNPGGYLSQAVSVANTFIERGTIVSTEGTTEPQTEIARPSRQILRDVPIAVLINEGSASASEIVSGALRHYADKGDIDAILIGQRTYGKGSVQNVWPLTPQSYLKLTTQYYKLPNGRIIHRKPGDSVWGVDPHWAVEMLPEQISDALKIRQDADTMPIDQQGNLIPNTNRPDPDKLLADGVDLQLQSALVVLQAKSVGRELAHSRGN